MARALRHAQNERRSRLADARKPAVAGEPAGAGARRDAARYAGLPPGCSAAGLESVRRAHARLQPLVRTLHAVSPLATLDRGYAIVSTERRRDPARCAPLPRGHASSRRAWLRAAMRAKVQGCVTAFRSLLGAGARCCCRRVRLQAMDLPRESAVPGGIKLLRLDRLRAALRRSSKPMGTGRWWSRRRGLGRRDRHPARRRPSGPMHGAVRDAGRRRAMIEFAVGDEALRQPIAQGRAAPGGPVREGSRASIENASSIDRALNHWSDAPPESIALAAAGARACAAARSACGASSTASRAIRIAAWTSPRPRGTPVLAPAAGDGRRYRRLFLHRQHGVARPWPRADQHVLPPERDRCAARTADRGRGSHRCGRHDRARHRPASALGREPEPGLGRPRPFSALAPRPSRTSRIRGFGDAK